MVTFTLKMIIYLTREAQIISLLIKEVTVSKEYLDFANVFSEKLAAELSKHTGINDYAIDLKKGKQPPYGLIYSLSLIELETLKTYIETNLANSFICSSKSPVNASILFVHKPNRSFWLYIDY